MGVRCNTYIGPFLICKIYKERTLIEKEKTFSACINSNCKSYRKDMKLIISVYKPNFCPNCGKELQEVIEKYKVPSFFAYDIVDEIDGKFTPAECGLEDEENTKEADVLTNVFIPNVQIDGLERTFSFDDNLEKSCTIIWDGQSLYEQEVLKNCFQKEIDIIKTHYDSVEIKWGIIHYFI